MLLMQLTLPEPNCFTKKVTSTWQPSQTLTEFSSGKSQCISTAYALLHSAESQCRQALEHTPGSYDCLTGCVVSINLLSVSLQSSYANSTEAVW